MQNFVRKWKINTHINFVRISSCALTFAGVAFVGTFSKPLLDRFVRICTYGKEGGGGKESTNSFSQKLTFPTVYQK
jgi:hypothetical protein